MESTNITLEYIKKIFQDIQTTPRSYYEKTRGNLHEYSIMQLILGNTTLTNQRLDNLSKEIARLEQSLGFTQEGTKEKFNKANEVISTMERNLFSVKKDIEVIQAIKPSWKQE